MKFLHSLLLAFLFSLTAAKAQWVSKSYSLVNGWNGIWLAGDASYTTVSSLIAGTNVVEVWRWNPNPDQIAFTSTPSQPTTLSDEWTVWQTANGGIKDLTKMVGNSAYLIKSSGATTLTIKQLVLPPAATWLVSGANFLGFPSAGTSTTAPTMSSYFASYPSGSTTVLSTPSKIYKYIGGELNSTNPMLVSAGTERLDSGKAYWFNVPTVGNFTAPVEYEVPSSTGLAFGRTLSTMTVGVTNRTTTSLTLTFTLENSLSDPSVSTSAVPVAVPLTHRVFNSSTNSYQESAIGGGFTVVVPASGHVNVDFGINRSAIPAEDSSVFYASILRVKDSANLSDVTLPVSAQPATFAGLWACQAKVTNVSNTAGVGGTTTSQPFPLNYLIHSDSAGQVLLLREAYVGSLMPESAAGSPMGISTREDRVYAFGTSDVEPHRYFCPQMPVGYIAAPYSPATIPGTQAPPNNIVVGGSVTQQISVEFDDPGNPFVHSYHPDHDNLSTTFTALPANNESYDITRTLGFTFTAAPPDGSSVTGWGTTVLGGTYTETLEGLNHAPLHVSGTFSMRRISEISTIDNPPPKSR